MKRLFIAISFLTLPLPLWAECLSVVAQGIETQAQEVGAARVAWHAEIDNRCRMPQDALLDIRFVDVDGETLYEVRDQTVLGRLGSKKIKRQVYIPAQHIEAIEDIEIELKERERPM